MKLLKSLNFGWGRRLPVFLQSQAAECGLVCLGMIANFFGHDIDLVSLRRRFSTSLKGATLSDVMAMATRLHLVSRPLRLEIGELGKLRCPCILHWEMSHFVVLKHVSHNKIAIHDPARGERDVSMDEVSRCFTGIALELLPSASFEHIEEKRALSIRRLFGNVLGLRSAFAQIFIMSIALEMFGVITPFYMQWVMDKVLVSMDSGLLTLLSLGFMMILIFQCAITALRSWSITWFSSLLSVQWTANVCAHLLGLPMAFFEQRHVGEIVSRFGSISAIQSTVTSRSIATILDGAMAIVTLVMLFIYSSTLPWVVIGLFVAYGVIRWVSYRPFRQASEDKLVYSARADTHLMESIRGAQAIKLGNKQGARVAAYANAIVEVTNKTVAIQRLSLSFSTVQSIISGLGRVALIWLAARQVLDGQFSAGMLVAFISFSDQFVGRASGLIDAFVDFRMLRLHAERLSDIVLTEGEKDMEQTALSSMLTEAGSAPSIEVKGLSFRYADTEPLVFDDCSFTIKPGESVALVGPSGQGKTTMAKLLLGLLVPEQGSVLVDGVDIRKIGLEAFRERIGCVMQDDILFAGSIAENICFFDAQPDQERIEEAARIAQIHDDICGMPMGYLSLVGDMGSALSGGQCQRVLLARALYRRPVILVLDEATSHLDVQREFLINTAVRGMSVTRVIIAHRPETIRSADRIVVLQQGKAHEVAAA